MSFSLAIIALLSGLSLGLAATVVIQHHRRRRMVTLMHGLREQFESIEHDVASAHRAARLAGLETDTLAANMASITRLREDAPWES